jgi:DNA polymerase alpha subunit A
MLLLNKKKYAALMINENKDGTVTYTKETKGLDLVRRDWCELSQDAGNFVLDQILSGTAADDVVSGIHDHMRQVASQVRNNQVPLNKYIIHKSLTKPPEAYPDAKGLPHVQVAKQLQARGDAITVGMHIQYVITKGDPGTNFATRAVHPEQIVRAEGLLEVDHEWYLSNQIHPPISRLLSPIDGTDSAQLAECLGLDAAKFRAIASRDEDEEDAAQGVAMDDSERFRDCVPFEMSCPACAASYRPAEISDWSKRLTCPSCQKTIPTALVLNTLTLAVRQAVAAYQDAWMVCEEETCSQRTRQVCFSNYIHGGSSMKTTTEIGRQCLALGCRGRMKREMGDRALYLQLLYFKSIFDVKRADAAIARKVSNKSELPEPLVSQMRRKGLLNHLTMCRGM